MRIIFHGAAQEVGRSCVELKTKNGKFLLDCGVKLGPVTEYPEQINNIPDIDAVIISHAHLDHTGGLAYMHSKGLRCPVYVTEPTKDLTKVLLKDFYHIESLAHIPPYDQSHIFSALNLFKVRDYESPFEIKGVQFRYVDAGHIPGSAMTVVDADGKRIVYSGDINTQDTRLIDGIHPTVKDVDALIIESTYGDREHPDRKKTEKEFLAKVKDVVSRGGSVFVPVFGVGRAQEMLLLLHSEKWKVPVFLDGSAEDVTNLIISENSCKDKGKLIEARAKTLFVAGRKEREHAVQRQGIFLSTSGMITGGPIIDYLKHGHQDPNNAILITGYCMEGTSGRMLLDRGSIFLDGKEVKVQAEYHKYDFSAHAGLSGLLYLIERLNPKTVIINHGDPDAVMHLAELVKKMGKEVYTPQLGTEITL